MYSHRRTKAKFYSRYRLTTSKVHLNYTYSRPAKKNNDPLHKPDRLIPGAADIPEEFYGELAALQDLKLPFKVIFDAEVV